MSTLTTELTVGELAARFPASLRIFEKLGIDYCCGGNVPFDRACQERHLDPAAVLAEIEGAGAPAVPQTDWTSAPLGSLIDHILSTHHVYMKREIPRLDAMFEKVLAKHGEGHGEVLRPLAQTFHAMAEEIDGHLMKEEMILFPLIRSIESGQGSEFHCGSVRNPIRVMLMEHDSAGDALARMRQLTGGYSAPEGACATFRALYAGLAEMEQDLHQHIHLENNILFPRVMEKE